MQSTYLIALTMLAYSLWNQRKEPLGVSNAFLWILLIFHGPALYFFTDIWGTELRFGQLENLTEVVSSPEIVPRVYLAMTLCLFSIFTGIWIFNITHTAERSRIESTPTEQLGAFSMEDALLAAKISGALIAIFLTMQFLFVSSPLSLINYYLSSIDEFEKVDIRRTSALVFYPYQVLLTAFFPFLSFVLIAAANSKTLPHEAHGRIFKHAAWLTALVLLAKLSQYSKAGPVIFIAQLLFAVTYARTGSLRIRRWHFGAFSIGLVAIIAMTSLVNSTADWALTLFSAFERTFMIPNEGIFEYFAAIPDRLPHGYGSGLSWVAALTGDGAKEATLGTYWEVAAVVRGDYGSTSNSFFIADAWAEFAWPGVIFLSLLAGWLVRWHDFQVINWGTSPVAIALLVSGYSAAYTLGTTALSTAMFTGGLVLTPWLANGLLRRRATTQNNDEAIAAGELNPNNGR